ncbi:MULTISPECIES: SMP-30/gluconolactonase/LRE family protein [Aliiglaciecola]|uniref:SMP-30/gluconolactonase/LRE family protein n=1 Tax=Aliiglaciecola TaxID=1406885 RepID=UPI001C098A95|nr:MULTISPECIES: SMP-30/gluconolactonase/LRE family protein [Aliiglaciecola]MBU2879907.1 SMP-30/gluconolactonase/LRE family protein [Aliiglaciecola lipolytica]MDO6712409.1 SMP-30/gluconolactonase/LRE family protein [Aliiglaciecola sp. 2_MG-2023]MDO6753403.1 SMP-30/gluconolactonase/LRE family protein [Aliiglaciecola sp. 1_MG-2023]
MSTMSINDAQFIGSGLVRPECVLATKAGNLYVSDFRGGVTKISSTGQVQFIGGEDVEGLGKLKPNGICMLADGSFLVAHLGDDSGGIYRVYRDNKIEPFLTEVEGQALPPTNFILLDHQERLWITVSTRQSPRAKGYRRDVADGFIVLVDGYGPRIVADNIGYTNEVCVTPDGKTLYANATFARQTLAFDIDENNNLGNRRIVAQYQKGIFPDGLTMDESGFLWITSIVSNSILRVDPKTSQVDLMMQDVEERHVNWVEDAFIQGAMNSSHLSTAQSKVFKNISSLAFGGLDRRTLYLGCLLGEAVAVLYGAVTGVAPAHWNFDSDTEYTIAKKV